METTFKKLAIGLGALALVTSFPYVAAGQGTMVHAVSLNVAQVSKGHDGRLVVTAVASGDIRGEFTIVVTGTDDDGSARGEWALVNTYIEDVAADGHVDGADATEDHEHSGGEILVQNGTINGTVVGGAVTFDGNGALASVSALRLVVTLGSLSFSSVQSGFGTVNISPSATDPTVLSGSVDLVF